MLIGFNDLMPDAHVGARTVVQGNHDSMRDGPMTKTVIVGGGISGLATAYTLQERGPRDYTLIEGSPRWGGKITSVHENGFTIEGGPDSFITQKAAGLDLCKRLGLEDQLVGSNSGKNAATFIWSGGRLHRMPEGMMLMAPTMVLPFLRSRLISWPGKMRAGLEVFIPRARGDEDESLAGFVRRRLGNELLNKIAGPLMGGIYAADPERMSLKSTFPMFLEMEKKHGSLLLGMMKRTRPRVAHGAKRPPMFMTLRGGLQQLSDALAARLPETNLRVGCRAISVSRYAERYKIDLSDGSSLLADDVVFATPSFVTADLVEQLDPTLAERLRAILYVSTATVSLGFRRSEIAHPLQGAGFIVPPGEGRRITACSWSSATFNHRAPEDCVLLRVFIGGALAEELAEQDEAALVQLAREELQVILGITATPVLARAYRWTKANPQYDLGHEERVAEIERSLPNLPGLHLAGAAYHGPGIPDCIQSGTKAAAAIAARQARGENSCRSDASSVCIES
jgi:oxygen-dependent protoporphyrinogen oxidase